MEDRNRTARGNAPTAHPWLWLCAAIGLGSLAATLPISVSRDLTLSMPDVLAAKGEGKGGRGGEGGKGGKGGKGEGGGHGGASSGGSTSGGKQSRASAAPDGSIEVRHGNGISETLEDGIYTMRDSRGRPIISRPARPADRSRLDRYLP